MALKLRHRLPLLIFTAMLPLIVILFYNLYSLQIAKEQEERGEIFRTGQLATLEFQRIVSGMQNVLATVSSSPAVQAFDTDRCGAFLASASKRIEGVATLGVIDLTGKIRCRQDPQGIGISLADRPYFKDTLASGSFVVGEYTESRVTKKALLPMAMPLRDESGKVIGVVALSVDLKWLQQVLEQRSLPKNGNLTVADRNGVILARCPFPDRFVGTRIPDVYQHLVSAKAPGIIQLMSQDGTERILAYFPVSAGPQGLYVSTGLSVADTFAAIRRATELGLAATLLAILLGLALSWQSTRYAIQRPVEHILAAVAAWRTNDASARTGMSSTSDEFGMIGAAFDTFMDELAKVNEQKELLIGELDHRVKNLLATISSVANQTFKGDAANREARKVFSDRLRAIADSFSLLRRGNWHAADFAELVSTAVAPFQNQEGTRFRLSGPNFQVTSRTALSFSMALHELCTNAAKYGALAKQNGYISVTWMIAPGEEPQLIFRWEEQDGPAVRPPEHSGFGSEMIQKVLASHIGAKIEMDYTPTGVKCKVTAPIANLSEDLGAG